MDDSRDKNQEVNQVDGTSIQRVQRGMWAPGQSGNPSGGGKVYESDKEHLQPWASTAVKQLVKLLKDPKTPAATRLKAITTVLDRVYGKPASAPEDRDSRASRDDAMRALADAITGGTAKAVKGIAEKANANVVDAEVVEPKRRSRSARAAEDDDQDED